MSQEAIDEIEETEGTIEDTDPAEVFDSEDGEEEESVEDRARLLGWTPKEEYKGDPEHWKDAETFVEEADSNFKGMRRANRFLENKVDKQQKALDAIISHHTREIAAKEAEAYERGKAEIEARHAQAVEDGDIDAANKAMEDRSKLQPPKQEDAAFVAWKEKNTWFDSDPVLTDAAIKYCDMHASETPEQQLAGAEKYIKETFPQKFRQPKQAPLTVNGRGNNVNKAPPAPGSYEALTQEARHECDRSVKEGVSQEAWLQYAEPHHFKQQGA